MFYTYKQSNSGAYYHINDKVAEYVIVEAETAEDSKSKFLNEIVEEYFIGCECGVCSDRWFNYGYMEDDDGTAFPEIYGIPPELFRYKGWFDSTDERTCVIYYSNGIRKYIHYNGEFLSPVKQNI